MDSSSNCPAADTDGNGTVTEEALETALGALSKETIWRVKGFVRFPKGVYILNWAFGRHELTAVGEAVDGESVKLTMMGERGEVKKAARRFSASLGAQVL